MNQKVITLNKNKCEVHKKGIEIIEKETAQKHVDKNIAVFDTPASGKILYQTYCNSLLPEAFVMLLPTVT